MLVELFPVVAALLAPFLTLSASKIAPLDCEYTVPVNWRGHRLSRMGT
jgi:hypothetical protein